MKRKKSDKEKALEKVCPIFTAVVMIHPSTKFVDLENMDKIAVKCLGEKCGFWSRLLEGCGVRSNK